MFFVHYSEVIQVMDFPPHTINVMEAYASFYSHLLHYKGASVRDRIWFLGIVLPYVSLDCFLVYPMKYAHFRNILPVYTFTFDMLISAKHSASGISLGFVKQFFIFVSLY